MNNKGKDKKKPEKTDKSKIGASASRSRAEVFSPVQTPNSPLFEVPYPMSHEPYDDAMRVLEQSTPFQLLIHLRCVDDLLIVFQLMRSLPGRSVIVYGS